MSKDYYQILEVDRGSSADEIKKSYRKMAMKFHPDKVRGLGETHEKAAAAKFIAVQEAYDHIKKDRGIK